MKKDLISETLLGAGFKKDYVNLLLSEDELPESFDNKTKFSEWEKDKNDLFLAQHAPVLKDQFKKELNTEIYAGVVNPLKNRFKAMGVFTDEEIQNNEPKVLLEMVAEKQKALVEQAKAEAGQKPDERLDKITSELVEMQTRYKEDMAKKEELISLKEQELENERKQTEIFKHNFAVDNYLGKLFNSDAIDWDLKDKVSIYSRIYIPELKERYHIKPDGKIFDKDGVKRAIALDGNGFYETATEALTDMARRDNNLKRSHGAQNNGAAMDKKTVEVRGKEVDNSGTNALKGFLKAT